MVLGFYVTLERHNKKSLRMILWKYCRPRLSLPIRMIKFLLCDLARLKIKVLVKDSFDFVTKSHFVSRFCHQTKPKHGKKTTVGHQIVAKDLKIGEKKCVGMDLNQGKIRK